MSKPIQTYTRTAYEIFEEISAMKKRDEKVAELKTYFDNSMIVQLLVLGFNDYVKQAIVLPDSVPTPKTHEKDEKGLYIPSPENSHPSNLIKEHKKLWMFINKSKSTPKNILRIERIYLGMLESIHPKDAELLANVMAGVWPYKKITKAMVKEALPFVLNKPEWA